MLGAGSRLLCCFMAITCVLETVTCLTNAEFYNLVQDYVTDVEEIDDDTFTPDDVIELPGLPDEEFDVEYLLQKLSEIQHPKNSSADTEVTSLQGVGCRCRRHSCYCCGSKRFSVKLWGRRRRFTLTVCVTAALRRNGFEITITVNGHRVYHKKISLRRSLSLCYHVPGLRIAKVCVNFYNINLRTKRICVRLTGSLNLVIKKFKIRLNIGCFRIPIVEKEYTLDHMIKDVTDNHMDALYVSDDGGSGSDFNDFETLDLLKDLISELQLSGTDGAMTTRNNTVDAYPYI